MRIAVVGSSLTGIAAALRLAKVGHEVVLVEREEALGGRWRDPALWPPLLHLPAAWRDLLRKSGRTLEAELGRHHLAWEPAPAPRHLLTSGVTLHLPTQRGMQTLTLDRTLGAPWGTRWTAALDRYDDMWQQLRRHGLEADEPVGRREWKALEPRRSLADEADQLGPAGDLLRMESWPYPAREVPAFMAARVSVEREFGAWRITDAGHRPVPATALLDLMLERLATRGVEVLTGCPVVRIAPRAVHTSTSTVAADAVIDATSPWSGLAPAPRRLHPALSPSVTSEPVEAASVPAEGAATVDHTRRTLSFPLYDGPSVRLVTWDFARPVADPSAGAAWEGARSWRRRPDLVDREGIIRASAASRGGAEPWAQLLTGALAAYQAHELGGGRSIRPVDDPRKQRRSS